MYMLDDTRTTISYVKESKKYRIYIGIGASCKCTVTFNVHARKRVLNYSEYFLLFRTLRTKKCFLAKSSNLQKFVNYNAAGTHFKHISTINFKYLLY